VTDGIDIADLPPRLAEIAELIGVPKTLKLVEARGGTRIYVPGTITSSHWLARLIGLAAARALSDHVADRSRGGRDVGDYLDIDRGAAALRALRDRRIIAAHANGVSATALALDYGMTERMIWYILAGSDNMADNQSDLFATG
jgi:hypothetical protein